MFVFKLLLILFNRGGVLRWIIKLWFYDNNKLTSGLHVLLTEFRIMIRSANDFIAYRFLTLNIWDIISVLSMRLVMFVRISRCPEYQSSYLPFEENHEQTKCANLTTETVFNITATAFERQYIMQRKTMFYQRFCLVFFTWIKGSVIFSLNISWPVFTVNLFYFFLHVLFYFFSIWRSAALNKLV